jgi:hypothetical protein
LGCPTHLKNLKSVFWILAKRISEKVGLDFLFVFLILGDLDAVGFTTTE